MASWMIHLRVADLLMDRIPGLDETAFVMGNIAPDSGVPNADWTAYSPPKAVSEGKTLVIECDPQQEVTKHIAQKFGFSQAETSDGLDVYRL